MAIELDDQTRRDIETMVQSGDYDSADAVISDAVAQLRHQRWLAAVGMKVQRSEEQIARGEFREDSEEFWESLEAESDADGENPDWHADPLVTPE